MATPALDMNVSSLLAIILGLQFAAFGWRINREIPVGDAGRKTWFPIPDVINIFSMLGVVAFCVISPLAAGHFTNTSRVVLAVAFILMAFHPLCLVGHYRLFSKHGRQIYLTPGKGKEADFPYCTGPEITLVILGLFMASVVGWLVWAQPNGQPRNSMNATPNTALQRTLPAAPVPPLSFEPLGRQKVL